MTANQHYDGCARAQNYPKGEGNISLRIAICRGKGEENHLSPLNYFKGEYLSSNLKHDFLKIFMITHNKLLPSI